MSVYDDLINLAPGDPWLAKFQAMAAQIQADFAAVLGGAITDALVYGAAQPSSAVDIQLSGASDMVQAVTMTAASKAVLLPDATTLVLGKPFIVRNAGTNVFALKDYAGGTVFAALGAGATCILRPINLATTAGTWDVLAVADTAVAQTWTKPQRPAVTALGNITGSVALDLNASGQDFTATTTGAITLANPTNIAAALGQKGSLTLDNSGGYALSGLGTYWKRLHTTGAPILPAGNCRFDFHVVSATRVEYSFAEVKA